MGSAPGELSESCIVQRNDVPPINVPALLADWPEIEGLMPCSKCQGMGQIYITPKKRPRCRACGAVGAVMVPGGPILESCPPGSPARVAWYAARARRKEPVFQRSDYRCLSPSGPVPTRHRKEEA